MRSAGDTGPVSTKLCTYCRTHLLDYIPSKGLRSGTKQKQQQQQQQTTAPSSLDEGLKVVGKRCPTGVVGVMLDPLEAPDMAALEAEWVLHDNVISKRVCGRLHEVVVQLVAAQGLPAEWAGPVERLASAAAADVLPMTEDKRDIRKYVRVKIVPGGSMNESAYLSAFSFGRKNVMLKGMQSQFVEPRVLLLDFPVDYQREQKILNIRDLITQERDHLRIIVNRIAAIKPDVVFVGRMVNHIAAEFLLHERITVFSNVKPTVMSALARYTGGAIIKSAAALSAMDPQNAANFLGHCHTLSSVDYTIGPGNIKTLFFLEGSPRLGGTVVLRGALPPVLEEVKRVLRFAIFVAHSLSVEHAYIAEELLHKVESTSGSAKSDEDCVCKICTKHSSSAVFPGTPQQTSKSSLSSSPTATIKISSNSSSESCDGNDDNSGNNSDPSTERPILMYEICGKMPERQYPVIKASLTHEYRGPGVTIKSPRRVMLTFSDFSTQGTSMPGYISLRRSPERDWVVESVLVQDNTAAANNNNNNNEALEPAHVTPVIWREFDIAHAARSYQYILVLHALARRDGARKQCLPYEILVFEFYGKKERSLGQFLEDFCFGTDKRCSAKDCGDPIYTHERSFLHNDGRVDITVDDAAKSLDAQAALREMGIPVAAAAAGAGAGAGDTTLHWRHCTLCHKASCAVPLSKESWNLSFGKFLEILFYSAGSSFLHFCPHSAGNHVVCFLRGTLLVRFTYTPLHLFSLVTPSLTQSYSAEAAATSKAKYLGDLCDRVRKTTDRTFDAIDSALIAVQQYADRVFRLQDQDHHHPLRAEIETFKELFLGALSSSRETASAERDEFLERLDGWNKYDILELHKIKWELYHTYRKWMRAIQDMLEPSLHTGHTPHQQPQQSQQSQITKSTSLSSFQQVQPQQPQQQQMQTSSSMPKHLSLSQLIQIPLPQDGTAAATTAAATDLGQSKAEVLASSSDGDDKTSILPWMAKKIASRFSKPTAVPTQPSSATAIPEPIHDATIPAMAGSVGRGRPDSLSYHKDQSSPNSSSSQSSSNTVGGNKSIPLTIPHSPTSASIMISASPVHISVYASPASAMSLDRAKHITSTGISPIVVPSIMPAVAGGGGGSGGCGGGGGGGGGDTSTCISQGQSPAPISRTVGPHGVFPTLTLAAFISTVTAANNATTQLIVNTGIVDDNDGDVPISASAFTLNSSISNGLDVTASSAATIGSSTTNILNNSNSAASGGNSSGALNAANSGINGAPQKAITFPPLPEIAVKDTNPVKDEGEMYFEKDDYPFIVIDKNEPSSIVAYALLNANDMKALNATLYGTVDSKPQAEQSPQNQSISSSSISQKPKVLLKSTIYSQPPLVAPKGGRGAPSSYILSSSYMPDAKSETCTSGRFINQSSYSYDAEPSIYDFSGSESDDYDNEVSSESDMESDDDGKADENSPVIGPKYSTQSPQPPSQHAPFQWQEQQQQQQIMPGEVLHEVLLKNLRTESEKVTFESSGSKKSSFTCTLHFAQQFYSLRRLCWGSEKDDTHFIRSLSKCSGWKVSGGKSKSHFDKTWDDRFILKELPKVELDGFISFASKYFNYLADAFTNAISTQLAKIYGVYTVKAPGFSKGYSFLVMENLHYGYSLKKVFDLKGALRGRFASDPSSVQLDGNLVSCKSYTLHC